MIKYCAFCRKSGYKTRTSTLATGIYFWSYPGRRYLKAYLCDMHIAEIDWIGAPSLYDQQDGDGSEGATAQQDDQDDVRTAQDGDDQHWVMLCYINGVTPTQADIWRRASDDYSRKYGGSAQDDQQS